MATEVDNEWANEESADRYTLSTLVREAKGRNVFDRAITRIKELEASNKSMGAALARMGQADKEKVE